MTEYELGQILYGVTSKGQIKTWRCNVNNLGEGVAELSIITQTKLDGKPTPRYEVISEGKNIGKANETTPMEQAVNEAESRYRKKIKQGMRTEIPTDLTKADCNLLGFPHPMRALPVKDVKKVEFKKNETYVQPKYDGHRAIVTRYEGRLLMYSRGGDEITTMGHILKHLEDKVAEGEFLDGELYMHGELLQDIGSYIKKYHEGISETIVFYVYDTILEVSYTQRYEILRIKLSDSNGPVYLSRTETVESMEEALAFRDQMIADGYEGAMLRCPDKGYEPKKKSRTLLKLKVFDDSEHTIIDVFAGKPRRVGDVELQVALFTCKTPEGKTFQVTSMGDMYEKDRTLRERESFLNKSLTVQHAGLTKDKIPFHPVALRLREDI